MTAAARRIQARIQLRRGDFTLDVDLDLDATCVSAVWGPSGAGKTTLLRAVAGLQRCDQAFVAVDGTVWQDDANGVFVPVHQRALGYVSQDAALFEHLDVAGNLRYALSRVPPAQRRVSLQQAVQWLGIAPLLQRRCSTLSGGERQRVAIARALSCSPRLLLLDEPLAALDAARKAEILPYLEQLHRTLDIPVLYVSHAQDEITRLTDTVVLLDAGRVQACGATTDLLTRLDLPLAHSESAASVLCATLLHHVHTDHLSVVRLPHGPELWLGHVQAEPGAAVRVRVQARDVSLALHQPSGTSILNILPATVAALSAQEPGQTLVALELGAQRLLARVTERSARLLNLRVGLPVYAQIKGVAILG